MGNIQPKPAPVPVPIPIPVKPKVSTPKTGKSAEIFVNKIMIL